MAQIKQTAPLFLMSVVLGLLVGIVATIFGRGLIWIGDVRNQHLWMLVPFLGLVGVLIVLCYHRFGKDLQKGMNLVLQTGKGENQTIPLRLVPLVFFATWLTHLFGGSAGREGVAVQIGATVSHQLSKKWQQAIPQQTIIAMGIAAGFAGLFQIPLAACFFAFEVLHFYRPTLQTIGAVLISSFTASFTSHTLGLEKFYHAIDPSSHLTFRQFLCLVLIAVCFGAIGQLFAGLLKKSKAVWARQVPNPLYRIFFGGLFLSVILLALHHGRYTGLGTNLIAASLEGQPIFSYDWLLKLVLTIWTLSIGFQGGEVTPLFAIGASSGVFLASLFGLPVALCAALGYSSVFASATRTWLAPILIGYEVFGASPLLFFVLSVSIARFVFSRFSIYSS